MRKDKSIPESECENFDMFDKKEEAPLSVEIEGANVLETGKSAKDDLRYFNINVAGEDIDYNPDVVRLFDGKSGRMLVFKRVVE